MRLVCFGLSHHTAPLEARERFYAAAPGLIDGGRWIDIDAAQRLGLQGSLVLSTCNRLEFYSALSPAGGADLEAPFELLREPLRQAFESCAPQNHCYPLEGRAVVLHLCRVACGLDSLVLGEPQILGQVAEAYQAGASTAAAGPALLAVFQAAVRAGKRARAETDISRHATSLGSVTVRVATSVLGDLTARNVLVIGAGEMAALTVKAMRRRGVGGVTIANRTHSSAVHLAERWQARAITLDALETALSEADLVVTATAAPQAMVTAVMVQRAMARRAGRPMLFVDLAVPRDVEPAVAALPNVRCLNLDELVAHLGAGLEQRERAVPQAEAIAAEEADRCWQWLAAQDVTQVITDLRVRAEAIRRGEVARTLRHLPHLNESERRHVDALSQALLNKLLHEPTRRLKSRAGDGSAAEYASALRALFGLGEPISTDEHPPTGDD